MSESLVLHYFDMTGRAEALRLVMAYGDVKFEDKRMSFPEFGAAKAAGKYPFNQVPAIEVNGEIIGQSDAILRFAAKKAGLYPTDELAALRVDELISFYNEFFDNFPGMSVPEAEKQKKTDEYIASTANPKIEILKKKLAASKSGFIANDKISAADFKLFGLIKFLMSGFVPTLPKDLFTKHDVIKAHYNKMQSLPAIEAYYATHPDVTMA